MVVSGAGALFAWGDGRLGQFDTGDAEDRPAPVLMRTALGGSPVLMVACGGSRSLAVTRAGAVWTFSASHLAACGAAAASRNLRPTRVPPQDFANRRIVSANTTSQDSSAVDDDGHLYMRDRVICRDDYEACGGATCPGGLGHADLGNKTTPTEIAQEVM